MALNLWRRHRRDCRAGHPEDHLSSEFDERKKGWKRCECPIVSSGTLNRKFRRQSTGQWEWANARPIARQWEVGGWQAENSQLSLDPPVIASSRISIENACKAFLTEGQEQAAFATQKKYRLMLAKFRAFSANRGYTLIDPMGTVRCARFSFLMVHQPPDRTTAHEYAKTFFEYCLSNEWVERNAARLIKNPKGRDAGDRRNEQKLPFTDDDIKRMYDACPHYGTKPTYKWTGGDLADFISLSITGLRISDVALFHIDRMQPTGEILIRTTKAGTFTHWFPTGFRSAYRHAPGSMAPTSLASTQPRALML